MASVDVLDGFAERGDDRLVGSELDEAAESFDRDLLGFLHFLARSFSASSVREASSPVPDRQDWRSCRCKFAGWRRDGECPGR